MPAKAKSTAPGISPELARLIRKSERADARLMAEKDSLDGFHPGNMRAAAALRCRVATFKAQSIADVLAKAAHTIVIWGHDCAQEEHEAATADGGCYLDDMARAVLLDLARLNGEGTLCA